jgi:hypothetical protein
VIRGHLSRARRSSDNFVSPTFRISPTPAHLASGYHQLESEFEFACRIRYRTPYWTKIKLKKDGGVHFLVAGFHQIVIYKPGKTDDDVVLGSGPLFYQRRD